MPIHNADIAAIFEEIADLLEIESANVFRVRAYRNAARILQELGKDARAMVEKGEDLTKLPGIGDDLGGPQGQPGRVVFPLHIAEFQVELDSLKTGHEIENIPPPLDKSQKRFIAEMHRGMLPAIVF